MKVKAFKREKFPIILRNLIIAEVLAYGAFLIIALSADWGEIYSTLFLAGYIRFEIIEFSLLAIVQIALIFFVFVRSIIKEKDIGQIISSGEHEKLEFKTSFRWDINRRQVNKDLEKAVMKTVTAFLNSEGGHLAIGINNEGEPTGLENDFTSLPRKNIDGFENHFNNLFNVMIGPEFRRFVRLSFDKVRDRTVCLINIEPSHQPAYLKTGDGEGFYIRTGNATTPLKMSEVSTYISSYRQR